MLLSVVRLGGLLRPRHWFERQFSQAEVENFGVATISNKDVSGLNVAMNDSFGVRGIERVGDVDAQCHQSVQVHWMTGDAVLQCRTFQELHRDERLPVLFTDVMDRADVGVTKGRCGLRFTPESAECMRLSGHTFRQKLERDEKVETCILGFVDDTHAAATELFEDAIVRDGLANHGWSNCVGRC